MVIDRFLAATLAGEKPAETSAATPAGVAWHWLAEGALQLLPAEPAGQGADLVLSAGVHGDETAPIEMLDRIVADLAAGRQSLAQRALVLLGNPAAIAAGRRFLDFDLNRLFGAAEIEPAARETARARLIERLIGEFYTGAPPGRERRRIHLDLHAAIRPSLIERFALLPFQRRRAYRRELIEALAAGGIQALLVNREPAGTLAYWTSDRWGAASATVELGRARPLGENRAEDFAAMDRALRDLLAGRLAGAAGSPRLFRVVAQIVKRSERLELRIADDTPNFTPFPRGTLLAQDGAYRYVVGHAQECVVFPNPKVAPGLRAALIVVEEPLASLPVE